MGLAASNSYVQNTVNSLTSVVNSTVNSVTQNIQTSCTGVNTFTGVVGSVPVRIDASGNIILAQCVPEPQIKSFVLNQVSQNSCGIQGGINNDLTQNINNQLATNINQWLQSNASANNGFLGFGISIAAAEGITTADLSQDIANSLTNNLQQTCSAAVSASNTGIVYFCGAYPDGIAISQSAVNTNLTSCMINNVTTAISNNTVLNDIVQKAAAQANASNTGVEGIFKWLIIAAAILGVLIIIGVLLYLIFAPKSGGQKPPPKGTQEKMALERRLMEERRIKEGRMGEERRMGEGREIGIGERRRLGGDRGMGGEIGERTKFQETEGETSAPKEGLFDRFERLGNRYADLASKYGKYME